MYEMFKVLNTNTTFRETGDIKGLVTRLPSH